MAEKQRRRRDRREGPALSVFCALAFAAVLWTWWKMFHDEGSFVTNVPFDLWSGMAGLAQSMLCFAQPSGCIAGCAVWWALSRRRSGADPVRRIRLLGFLLGGACALGAAFYVGLASGAFGGMVIATVAHFLISALCAAILAFLLELAKSLSFKEIVFGACLAIGVYVLFRGIVLPALQPAGGIGIGLAPLLHIALTVVLVALLCFARPALLRAAGSAGGAEALRGEGGGKSALRKTLFAFPSVHLIAFGVGFGLYHKVMSISFGVDYSYRPALILAGGVLVVAVAKTMFAGRPKANAIWTRVRGTVFPFLVVGLLLLCLSVMVPSASWAFGDAAGVALHFAEYFYDVLFVLGCYLMMRETEVAPLVVAAGAMLLRNIGLLIGQTVGTAVNGCVQPGAPAAITAITLGVFVALCVGSFCIGSDDALRKWWGLRIDLSPKAHRDAVLRAKCHYLESHYGLSRREGEVLALMAEGRRAAQIEQELCISIHTVRNHIQSVYRKLGVHSFKQLADVILSIDLSDDK